MKLAAYLAENEISYRAFAQRIGTPHARTVERYAKARQRPNATMMARIVRETEGAVGPADFYDLAEPGADAAHKAA